MVNLKKIMAATAIAGAFGFIALGPSPGVVNAAPPFSGTSGAPLPQDDGGWWWGPGHGHGHGHWGRGWGPGWGDPGYYGGGLSACVNAGGPWGYVSGSVCI